MKNEHLILSHVAELLSTTVGRTAGEPKVILTIRVNSERSFESVNLAFSPEQACRLIQDLEGLILESEWLATLGKDGADGLTK